MSSFSPSLALFYFLLALFVLIALGLALRVELLRRAFCTVSGFCALLYPFLAVFIIGDAIVHPHKIIRLAKSSASFTLADSPAAFISWAIGVAVSAVLVGMIGFALAQFALRRDNSNNSFKGNTS